ncbi:hypothetical protein SAMN04487917_101719 [Arthrobacter sp. yr096]|nr:hypothetical protein SAMN04487917_101719 [Arthrobacter sp. yr096]
MQRQAVSQHGATNPSQAVSQHGATNPSGVVRLPGQLRTVVDSFPRASLRRGGPRDLPMDSPFTSLPPSRA